MAAWLPILRDGDLGRSHLQDSLLEGTRPVLPPKGGVLVTRVVIRAKPLDRV